MTQPKIISNYTGNPVELHEYIESRMESHDNSCGRGELENMHDEIIILRKQSSLLFALLIERTNTNISDVTDLIGDRWSGGFKLNGEGV